MMPDGNADILYIHPAKQDVGFPFHDPACAMASPYALLPVGVIGLVNLLRGEGYKVAGINLPLECYLDKDFSLRQWLEQHTSAKMVLIDLQWYEHCYGAMDVAQTVRHTLPTTCIALGGLTASIFWQDILEGFSCVDCIIRGDAEEPLIVLATSIFDSHPSSTIPNLAYQDADGVHENARTYCGDRAMMDRLDVTDISFLEHKDDYACFQYVGGQEPIVLGEPSDRRGHWLLNGRGCIYDCAYCGGSHSSHARIAGRKGLVMRSVDRVLDDIRILQDQGIKQVALTIDPAICAESYWRRLLAGMAKLKPRMGIYNECFQLPPPGFVDCLSEAVSREHSQIALSPLSGDVRVRRLNGKQFSNAELLSCTRRLASNRIACAIYFSMNIPGETSKTFLKTRALAEEIGRRFPPRLLRMFNQPHTIDPYSPMSENPQEYGIDVDVKGFYDYFDYCRSSANTPITSTLERGFHSVGTNLKDLDKVQSMWMSFAQQQRFPCF